jgi:hypothetical protein
VRTAILVVLVFGASLLATACAPAAAAVVPSAAVSDRPAVALAAAAEGELTLDITGLI